MREVRRLGAAVIVAAGLVVATPSLASAHVHGITPLRCTPAPANAGANQTDQTPASGNPGPIEGVIPITAGGNVPLNGGGFDAAVCTH